jgi:hypothetical protein
MEECLKVKELAERLLKVNAGCFTGTSFRFKLDEFIMPETVKK